MVFGTFTYHICMLKQNDQGVNDWKDGRDCDLYYLYTCFTNEITWTTLPLKLTSLADDETQLDAIDIDEAITESSWTAIKISGR